MNADTQAYIDARITELRNTLLGQIRELFDRLADVRAELRELALRNEKLESNRRRL